MLALGFTSIRRSKKLLTFLRKKSSSVSEVYICLGSGRSIIVTAPMPIRMMTLHDATVGQTLEYSAGLRETINNQTTTENAVDRQTMMNNNEGRKPRMSRAEKQGRSQARQEGLLKQQQQNDRLCTKRVRKHKNDEGDSNNLSTMERIIKTAQHCRFTCAVNVLQSNNSNNGDIVECRSKSSENNETIDLVSNEKSCSRIQIISSCGSPPVAASDAVTTFQTTITIYIKPLLVLDINGILCHRIRPRKEHPEVMAHDPKQFFRPILKHIANTNIVARTDLHAFLDYLSFHFCLAVWTSAKAKNAKLLVDTLFPDEIAKRLLFIWAQHDCQKMINNENVNDPIFVKDLQKVWDKYPLWNSSNTLLIDDSPDKCFSWQENAVHPPAMNGIREEKVKTIQEKMKSFMSDQHNTSIQRRFFEHFVDHWSQNNIIQEWDSESGDAIITHNTRRQIDFLREHAVGHFGWTFDSK